MAPKPTSKAAKEAAAAAAATEQGSSAPAATTKSIEAAEKPPTDAAPKTVTEPPASSQTPEPPVTSSAPGVFTLQGGVLSPTTITGAVIDGQSRHLTKGDELRQLDEASAVTVTGDEDAALQSVFGTDDSPRPWPGLMRAASDVFEERLRHVTGEGFELERDDTYVNRELVGAAICYALPASSLPLHRVVFSWPLAPGTFKPTSPRTCLVKAAALILAEIERLDRAEAVSAD